MLPKRCLDRSHVHRDFSVATQRQIPPSVWCSANRDKCRRIATEVVRITRRAYRPAGVKQTANTGASASPAAKAPVEPLRVLVAEDDSDTRRTLVELLRSEGHLAEGAVSASDFWRVFHRLGPAVCLIDIGLPDRSGYEIAQEMTRRYREDRPKLVAVTAWT